MIARCDRCSGILLPGVDGWGAYWQCLLCGVYHDHGPAGDGALALAEEMTLEPLHPHDYRLPVVREKTERHAGCP